MTFDPDGLCGKVSVFCGSFAVVCGLIFFFPKKTKQINNTATVSFEVVTKPEVETHPFVVSLIFLVILSTFRPLPQRHEDKRQAKHKETRRRTFRRSFCF